MGRTKRSTRETAVKQKTCKSNPHKTENTDSAELTEVSKNQNGKSVPEKGQPSEEKTNVQRQKRKLSQPQTQGVNSYSSKRQRIGSKTVPQESDTTTHSQQSPQDTTQKSRRQTRTRERKTSNHQQSAVTLSEEKPEPKSGRMKEEKSVPDSGPEKKPAPKSRTRKSTKKAGGGSHSVTSTAVCEDEVKKESESEVGKVSCDTGTSQKLVGAHCSIAGGLHKAVEEAVSMGGRAFGLFLRSQRTWTSKPLDPEAADKFKAACKEHGFPPNSILPHGSYLMNCGSPNPETLSKSREALLEELQRCEALGLTLYNFHPGSTCGEISIEKCLDSIADAINWAHQQTKFAITVIENMSCQGHTVGGRFEELKGIIDRVKDKSRIGVCLDTCHAFAAGFDLSTKEGFQKFVSDFDSIVGFQYLRAMHLNDSKGEVGCHLDRHENIGKGKIGLEGFRRVMVEPRFDGIPMILETPLGDYAKEIRILNRLVK